MYAEEGKKKEATLGAAVGSGGVSKRRGEDVPAGKSDIRSGQQTPDGSPLSTSVWKDSWESEK
jgi:hypothetical protein